MELCTTTRPPLPSLSLNLDLDVTKRLADLRAWRAAWEAEDRRLQQQIASLDPKRRSDVFLGSQIGSLRRALCLELTQAPISLDPEEAQRIGWTRLRHHLAPQYAHLDLADRQLWLANLSFLLTPTLRMLVTKLDAIRRYRSLGQARCFLLGGVSGAGKTSALNWYAFQYLPTVEAIRNHVPVIKIDAPVSNRSPKPLFLRMLMACGAAPLRGDEEHYLELLELYFQRCGVELLIVDEVEHITQPALRRRLLELSNLTGVPIVCASCNPIAWTSGDAEIQGRWNDYFELTQFTGARLDAFLTLLDLLLPFEEDSRLGLREIVDAQGHPIAAGPAHYIEEWTDGILREIMVLLLDACLKALATGRACLSVELLEQAWRDIKRAKVVNFLDLLRAQTGGSHA
ncbi:MAG: TniB family NTP-binding protein [Chloroflexi bacterium]|nr:TniB family NTP-binding protein [Chloroflexota bacterium]